LLALPVEHRLDRYTGTYRVPIVGLELLINRKGERLTMGRAEGGEGPLTELSYGIFSGGGITIAFDSNEKGVTGEAKITLKGQSFSVARVKS